MNNQYIKAKLFFIVFPFLLLTIFPMGALIYTLMFLIIASKYVGVIERRLLALGSILAYSLVVSSRGMFLHQHDDFIRYYDLYKGLIDGNLELLFSYGSGVEVGLPILYYFFGYINPVTSPTLVAFEGSLCVFLILFIWLEKHGLNYIDNKNKSLVVGVTLLFFAAYDTSQLIRQMFSTSILLFTLTSKGKEKYLYLLLATLFHTTAIVIFLFIEGLRVRPKMTIYIGCVLGLIFVLFQDLILSNLLGSNAISQKMDIYKSSDGSTNSSTVVQNIKIYFLCFLFLLLNPKRIEIIKWKEFTIFFTILFFLFQYLPMTADRVAMIYIGILYGYLLCISLLEYNRQILIAFSFSFLFLTIKNIALSGLYWVNFDLFGLPFYYINI